MKTKDFVEEIELEAQLEREEAGIYPEDVIEEEVEEKLPEDAD